MVELRRERMEGWLLYIFISCVALQVKGGGMKLVPIKQDTGTIIRGTMGQFWNFGVLWNDVTDQLLRIHILRNGIPESCKTTTKLNLQEFESFHMANTSEWFEHLKISEQQRISAFAFDKFVTKDNSPELVHRSWGKDIYSLNAKINFTKEILDINHPLLRAIYDTDIIARSSGYATHVITGVIKGWFAELLIISPEQSLGIVEDTELKVLLEDAAEEMNGRGQLSEKNRDNILTKIRNFTVASSSNLNGGMTSSFYRSNKKAIKYFEEMKEIFSRRARVGPSPIFFVLTPLKEFYQFIPLSNSPRRNLPHEPMSDDVKSQLLEFTLEFWEKKKQVESLCTKLTSYGELFQTKIDSNLTSVLCHVYEEEDIREKYSQVLEKMRNLHSRESEMEVVEEFFQYFNTSWYNDANVGRFNDYISSYNSAIELHDKFSNARRTLEVANVQNVFGWEHSVWSYTRSSAKSFVLYFDSRLAQNETYVKLFIKHKDKLLAIKHHDDKGLLLMSDCAKNECKKVCSDKENFVCITEYIYAEVHIEDLFSCLKEKGEPCGVGKIRPVIHVILGLLWIIRYIS